MASAPNVVEDGIETTGTGGELPDRSRWGWLTVGLIIGAGLSVLILRVDTPALPTTTTVATFEADPTRNGIAGVVEGFPDGLVAVLRSDGQSLVLLT